MKVTYKTMVDYPTWKPQTDYSKRKDGRFGQQTIADGGARVIAEIQAFTRVGRGSRTEHISISAWQGTLNQNGSFAGGKDNNQAPEVLVSFNLDGIEYVIPCDTFTRASQNLCAIAETIKGLRANERYGVLTIRQMMQGVAELPMVSSAKQKAWWEVLNLDRNSSKAMAEGAYRELAKSRHPNAGGTDQEWHELQEAINSARQVAK